MKIVLLHHAAHPVIGGVENVIREHARLMAGEGHSVRVIAGRGEQADEGIIFERVPLVDSRAPDVLEAKIALDAGAVPAGFEALSKRIELELRPLFSDTDVVFAHNVCSLNKSLALTAALWRLVRELQTPRFVLWHHDLAWTTPRYRPQMHAGYPWDLVRTDWPAVTQVTISQQRQAELARLFQVPPERIKVIPNGIDSATFLGLHDLTRNLLRDLGLLDTAPLILLPARITRRKNIEMAIRIVAHLREHFPTARLVVTGPEGPHNPANAEYLGSLIALRKELQLDDAVMFLTPAAAMSIPDEVIADLYRMADVLLFPSFEEGFGIPILEAGLARIPVFCADIEPLRELGGSYASYFSPAEDPKEVARRIGKRLDASPAYWLRQRVLKDYDWERVYKTHIAPMLESF